MSLEATTSDARGDIKMAKEQHLLQLESEIKSKEQLDAAYRAYTAYIDQLLKANKITPEVSKKWLDSATAGKGFAFESKADGDDFCKQLAQTGKRFIAPWVGPDGTPTGEYNFSNGDGKIYQGTFSPETMSEYLKTAKDIKDPKIKDQIAMAFETQDEPKLKDALEQLRNPTQVMRAAMTEMRPAAPSSTDEDEARNTRRPI